MAHLAQTAAGRLRVLWVIKGFGRGVAEPLLVEHARLGDRDRFDYHWAYLLERKQDLIGDLHDADVTVHALWDDAPWPLSIGQDVDCRLRNR